MADRRITKTKAAISRALFDIILVKNISDITVTELCQKANINRKTFYSHYSNITDVVNESFDEIIDSYAELMETLAPDYNSSIFDVFSSFMIRSIQYNGDIARLLKTSNGMWLEEKLQEAMARIIMETFRKSHTSAISDPAKISIASDYISAGIVKVYCNWSLSSDTSSPDEVLKLLSDMILHGISCFEE